MQARISRDRILGLDRSKRLAPRLARALSQFHFLWGLRRGFGFFSTWISLGCLHFAGDIAKHDICADERDHFAAVKPNVNVSRLMVVGINRDRVLSNPRYL